MAIKLLLCGLRAPGGGTDPSVFRAVTTLPSLGFLEERSFDFTSSAREYVAGRYSYESGGAQGGGWGDGPGGRAKGDVEATRGGGRKGRQVDMVGGSGGMGVSG